MAERTPREGEPPGETQEPAVGETQLDAEAAIRQVRQLDEDLKNLTARKEQLERLALGNIQPRVLTYGPSEYVEWG